MKLRFFATIVAFCVFTSSSQAGLIQDVWKTPGDNKVVFDNVTGLNWLDLSVTEGLSLADSLALDTSYSLATNSQVTDLFNTLFPNYVNTKTSGPGYYNFEQVTAGNITKIAEITNMVSLFGSTAINPSVKMSLGLYRDENDQIRYMGGNSYSNIVYGMDYSQGPFSTGANGNIGWLLVKNAGPQTSVPEPSTLVIFALGIIGLASRRFKKQ